jgi:hypothetical protein
MAGMVAAVPMGLFMMLASAAWGHAGVYTPWYRIAAILDPVPFELSREEAATGSPFWFDIQSAVPGFCVHLVLAGFLGALFVLLARARRVAGPRGLLVAGGAWGLLVAAVMVPVLHLAARVLGGGTTIADLPGQLGAATYVAMHLVYGLGLGAVVARWPARPAPA